METDTNYKKLIRMIHSISEPFDPIGDIQELLDSGYDVNYVMPIDCRIKEWRGCTAYHLIVKELHEKYLSAAVNLFSKFNASVTYQNSDGCTPAHLLLQLAETSSYPEDVLECLDTLLIFQMESKNAINPRCKDGISHLHLACLRKNLKVVEFLLTAGASVHEAINDDSKLLHGYTAMHIALRNQDKEMVQLLVNYGADLKCSNADGMTPLQLLFYKELIDDLFCKGRYHFDSELDQNKYILEFILKSKEDSLIGLNQLHKWCIEKTDAKEFEDFHKFINSHVKFDSLVWPGFTALHFAAQNNLEIFMLLLGNGADLLAKDANGITPLDLCCDNYKPSVIGSILKTQKELGHIYFQNGENLADSIDVFDNENKLESYLKTADVNNAISIDSPLWPGYSFLHLAVLLSGEKQVKLCLEYGANFLIKDVNNMTALHLAFRLRKKDCINGILNAHTTISENPVDNDNLSHFHIACIFSNTKVVEAFLNFKVDPNAPTSLPYVVKRSLLFFENVEMQIPAGSTALHIAAAVRSEDLIKLLVKSRADPNLRDSDGLTWVHRMGFTNDIALQKYLWEHPESLKSNPVAPGGLSHLHIACFSGNLHAVETLLRLAIDVNEAVDNELMKRIKIAYRKFFSHLCVGNTPLHMAVQSRDHSEEIVDLLLKKGADVTVKNSKGYNPIYVCCKANVHSPTKTNTLERLVREYKNKGKSLDGLTALHFACALKDLPLIKEFLQEGEDIYSQIDIDSQMWPGQTPLSIVIQYLISRDEAYLIYPLEDDCVKVILKYFLEKLKISKNDEPDKPAKRRRLQSPLQTRELVINKDGLTAFHVCCMGDDPALVERFILSGVDINAQVDELTTPFTGCQVDNSRAGFTPLHYAVMDGSDSVLEMLLKYNADFTIEDVRGRTPVHLAAEKSFDKIYVFTKLCNIDANMKNTLGNTLMDSFVKNPLILAEYCQYLLKLNFTFDVNSPIKLFTYLRSWARNLSRSKFKKIIDCVPTEFLSNALNFNDSQGCNVIHHLVSTILYLDTQYFRDDFFIAKFAKNIEVLSSKGCELDHQDNDGKTPLHYAVHFKQIGTVDALLRIGADVNVADKYGITPYMYCYQPDHYTIYDSMEDVSDETMLIFERHVKQLQAAGLHLSETNEECYQTNDGSDDNADCSEVLDRMAKREICKSYSVRTILTDDIITRFPLIPLDQRREILKYLESNVLHKEFPDFSALLKLQHRRILKSLKLFEPAFNSLRNFLDPRLPDHVLDSVMTFLSIYDWSNLRNASL